MRNEDITPELAELVAAHPSLFRGAAPYIASYLAFGWYGLVDKLCCDIESILGADVKHFECRQIKEKFGALRFYWAYKKMAEVHVDIIGAGLIESIVNVPHTTDERLLRIRHLVSLAVEASESTCETCGSPGRLGVRRGYYLTRCNRHA